MKRLLVVIVMIVFTLSLNPSQSAALEAVSLNHIEVVEASYHDAFFMPTFHLSDIQFDLTYDDGSLERIALCYSMLSQEDQDKLHQRGRHEVLVRYDAFEVLLQIQLYDEEDWFHKSLIDWLQTLNHTLFKQDDIGVYLSLDEDTEPFYMWRLEDLKGPPGTAAQSPQLKFEDGTLLWWEGTEWKALMTLKDVLEPWRLSPHLRMEESNLQWLNEGHWETLFNLKDLQGPQGVTGSAGHSPVLRLEDDSLQWFDGIIWHDLLDVTSLEGATGVQGPQGVTGSAGRSPVMRLEDDLLQWFDGEIWHNLFDFNTLMEPFSSQISVRFVDDHNNLIEQRWHDPNGALHPPEAPHKDGKTFAHWQGLNAVITQATIITAVYDTQFHAVRYYDENQQYRTTVLVTSGAWLPTLELPISNGYHFQGWSRDEDNLSAVISTPLRVHQNLSLYASVIPKRYHLDFHVIDKEFHPHGIVLNPGESIVTMALGLEHGLLLTTHQRVLIWGSPEHGPFLKEHTARPQDITALFDFEPDEVITLFSGSHHSAVLTQRGALWLFGQNTAGETLHSAHDDASLPHRVDHLGVLDADENIIDVALAPQRTTVLTNRGRVFVWGDNPNGVLGTGDTLSYTIPQEITPNLASEEDRIISIHTSLEHQGFLTQEGQLYLFGSNRYGQIFPELGRSLTTPVAINEHLNLNVNETIVDFALGSRHTGVLTSEGRLLTWGFNTQGQLGMGTTDRTSEVFDLTHHFYHPLKTLTFSDTISAVQDLDGNTYAWGTLASASPFEPALWQALLPELLDYAIDRMHIGPNHLSYLSEGWVYSMGSNSHLHGFNDGVLREFSRSHVYPSLTVYQTFQNYQEPMTRFDVLYPAYTWFKDADLSVVWSGGTMPAYDVVIYGILQEE